MLSSPSRRTFFPEGSLERERVDTSLRMQDLAGGDDSAGEGSPASPGPHPRHRPGTGAGAGQSCPCQGRCPPAQRPSGDERQRGRGIILPLPRAPRGAPRAAAGPGSAGRGGHSPQVLPIVLIAARPQLRVVVVGRGRRSGGGSGGEAGSRAEPGRRRGAEGAGSPHRRRHLRCCRLLLPPRRLPGTPSGRRRRRDPDVGRARGGAAALRPLPQRLPPLLQRLPRPRTAARALGRAALPSAPLPVRVLPRAGGCAVPCRWLSGQPQPCRTHLASQRSKCGSGARCVFWGGQGGRPLQEASLLAFPLKNIA